MNNAHIQCQTGRLELGIKLRIAQCTEAAGCWALGLEKTH